MCTRRQVADIFVLEDHWSTDKPQTNSRNIRNSGKYLYHGKPGEMLTPAFFSSLVLLAITFDLSQPCSVRTEIGKPYTTTNNFPDLHCKVENLPLHENTIKKDYRIFNIYEKSSSLREFTTFGNGVQL